MPGSMRASCCLTLILPTAVLKASYAHLQQFHGLSGSGSGRDLEHFSALLIVRDKKCLDLIEKNPADVGDTSQVLIAIRMDCGADQAIIPSGLPVFGLLCLDNPENSYLDQAAHV